MQKSMIINSQESIQQLNDQLKLGWKVIHTCPMPSSCSIAIASNSIFTRDISTPPHCLVIIERIDR